MIRKFLHALCALLLLSETIMAQRSVVATPTSATAGTQTWPSTVLRYPSGFQLSWDSADVTLTHSANALTFAGGNVVVPTLNSLTVTTSTGTVTITNAKVFTVSNTLTLAGTDGSTLNVGTGGTLGTLAFANKTGLDFLTITGSLGAELPGLYIDYEDDGSAAPAFGINTIAGFNGNIFSFTVNDVQRLTLDEEGLLSGVGLNFTAGTVENFTVTDTFTTATLNSEVFRILDAVDKSHGLSLVVVSDLTAHRNLNITTGDSDRSLTLNGNATLNDWFDQSVKTTAAPTFATIDTGQGANELYDMDQNVLTSSSPTFTNVTVGTEAYDATGWNGDLTVPTKDAVRDKIETLSGGGAVYVLQLSEYGTLNLADATTYYYGFAQETWTVSATSMRMYVPTTGTITKVVYQGFYAVAGSNEDVTHVIRINDTSDVCSATSDYDSAGLISSAVWTGTQAITAADLISVKLTTPTWATNPTGIRGGALIYITVP